MIFYLSGTGNTLWAAKKIADATGEALISIAEAIYGDCCFNLSKTERIGFCFPVHGWRPPKLVRQFIGKLKINNPSNHYCYALCSAGDTIGETMEFLQADLHNAGLHAESLFSIIMPESYVGLPFMDVDTKENEKHKIEKAAGQLEIITQHVLSRDKGVEMLTKGRWPRINSRLLGKIFIDKIVTDKPFHVNSDRCVKCGICYDVCPVHNITGGLGQEPQWKHDGSCLSCFACYHHCPHHAIEYGIRTKNKGQYFFKNL